MFRPTNTLWIDLLVEREAGPRILDDLAAAGIIELQRESADEQPFELLSGRLNGERLQRLEALRERFAAILPPASPEQLSVAARYSPIAQALEDIEDTLSRWSKQATPQVEQLQKIGAELENLALLKACLEALPDERLNLALSATDRKTLRFTPWLALVTDMNAVPHLGLSAEMLLQTYPGADDHHGNTVLLGLSERNVQADVERSLSAAGARFVPIPCWLDRQPVQARQQIRQRCAELRGRKKSLSNELNKLEQESGLAGALWLLDRYHWLHRVYGQLGCGRHFLWITGWVPRNRLTELQQRLERSESPFLLRSDAGSGHGTVPIVLRNPPWMKRFEIFIRSFGMPSRNEVDPSPLLAIVMPLMFGYMFGDVGQGAVVMLAGWLLRNRYPVMALFIPAGFAAMIFGLLFGVVFFSERLIEPLWLQPLSDPLLILLLPLGLGALLILISMLFAAIEAYWHGIQNDWWGNGFALMLLYVGMATLLFSFQTGLMVIAAAVGWRLVAAILYGFYSTQRHGILMETGKALATLIEATVQLATNTVSFTRVGAFALAHAGLGLAVTTLSEQAGYAAAQTLIWILGNIITIVLEGLIVSIQATRLVMFEFFRRFTHGEGRPFHPLSLPEPGRKQQQHGST